MIRMNLSKSLGTAALIGATLISASALAADPSQGASGPGMGPGMTGGMTGGMMGGMMGSGMMGSGMMGSGMMGGMMGSGMMGSGMMGGMMGSGMMGSGMMGGMMGPGMMGGFGMRADLNLTAEQRGKIATIQNDARRSQWDLMGKINDEQSQMREMYDSDKRDDTALSKSYRKISELRQQMFDLSLATQKQISAVLTQEQRDQVKRGDSGMHRC